MKGKAPSRLLEHEMLDYWVKSGEEAQLALQNMGKVLRSYRHHLPSRFRFFPSTKIWPLQRNVADFLKEPGT